MAPHCGQVFSFGRDVNIRYKHGINALPEARQQRGGGGRISIILWGQCEDTVEEADSPPMINNAEDFAAGKGAIHGRGGPTH